MRPAALNTEVSETRRFWGWGVVILLGEEVQSRVNICQFDTENGIKLTIFSKHLVKMTSFMVSY